MVKSFSWCTSLSHTRLDEKRYSLASFWLFLNNFRRLSLKQYFLRYKQHFMFTTISIFYRGFLICFHFSKVCIFKHFELVENFPWHSIVLKIYNCYHNQWMNFLRVFRKLWFSLNEKQQSNGHEIRFMLIKTN